LLIVQSLLDLIQQLSGYQPFNHFCLTPVNACEIPVLHHDFSYLGFSKAKTLLYKIFKRY